MQDDQPTFLIGNVGVITHDVDAIWRARGVKVTYLSRVGLVSNGDDTKPSWSIRHVSVVTYDMNAICIACCVEEADLDRVGLDCNGDDTKALTPIGT